MSDLVIAIDAMGGDLGPRQSVPALLQALSICPALKFIVVGDSSVLDPVLKAHGLFSHSHIERVHAPDVIGQDQSVPELLRSADYHTSSMWIALNTVHRKQAIACVSAGNTGALMALGKSTFGLIEGLTRPALMAEIPNPTKGYSLMLDLGANLECSSNLLMQFAYMGHVYAQDVLQIPSPRISLLNVGQESHKGSPTVQAVALQLQDSTLNYQGFIEGSQIFTGCTDVIVCNGFVGNVALKTAEGVAKQMVRSLEENRFLRMFKQWFLQKRLSYWEPEHYNGAALLGLQRILMKSHGQSSSHGFCRAILRAADSAKYDLSQKMADQFRIVFESSPKGMS